MPATEVRVQREVPYQFCGNCAPARRELGLAPNRLFTLVEKTENSGLEVRVCPECDQNPGSTTIPNYWNIDDGEDEPAIS